MKIAEKTLNDSRFSYSSGRSRSLLQNQDAPNTDPNTSPYGPRDTLPKSPVPHSVLPGRSRSLLFSKEVVEDERMASDPYGVAYDEGESPSKMASITHAPAGAADPKHYLRENHTTQLLFRMADQKIDVGDLGGLGLDIGGKAPRPDTSPFIGGTQDGSVSIDLEGFGDNRQMPVVEEL